MSTWVMNLKMVLSRVPSEKGFLRVMRYVMPRRGTMMRSAFAALRFAELVCPTLLGARSLDTTTWVSDWVGALNFYSTYYCDKCYFWDTSVGQNTNPKIELFRNSLMMGFVVFSPPWSIWGRRCCRWGEGRWEGCRAGSQAATARGGTGKRVGREPLSRARRSPVQSPWSDQALSITGVVVVVMMWASLYIWEKRVKCLSQKTWYLNFPELSPAVLTLARPLAACNAFRWLH